MVPTKRVSKYIDNDERLYLDAHNVTIYAEWHDSEWVFDGFDPETCKYVNISRKPPYYTLSSHEGYMPAFHISKFDTLEELCKAMQKYDLRKWRVLK